MPHKKGHKKAKKLAQLEAITVPHEGEHTHSVILLHGTYYDATESEDIAECVSGLVGEAKGVKYIYPNSPLNEDEDHFWYEYLAEGDAPLMQCDNDEIDKKQWQTQILRIRAIVDDEVQSLGDASKVIIGGNSAGGTIAIHVALTYPQPLGGLLCLRTCPMRETLGPCPVEPLEGEPDGSNVNRGNSRMPIFVYQAGLDDTYVPDLQRRNYGCIEKHGFEVKYKVNPEGRHEDDDPEENASIAHWVAQIFFGKEVIESEAKDAASCCLL